NLGGPECVETLCSMKKQAAELDGSIFFSDPRLVANGFKIKLTPGTVQTDLQSKTFTMTLLGWRVVERVPHGAAVWGLSPDSGGVSGCLHPFSLPVSCLNAINKVHYSNNLYIFLNNRTLLTGLCKSLDPVFLSVLLPFKQPDFAAFHSFFREMFN
ncbi:hypothetical protein ILYODFUR_009085, partial [Ilyodon furcidens]